MRARFQPAHVGKRVVCWRTAESAPVAAVVVDASELGVPCVARLTKAGVVRAERLWTGLWWDVVPCDTEAQQQAVCAGPDVLGGPVVQP